MSIYRRDAHVPISDVHATPRKQDSAKKEPLKTEQQPPSDAPGPVPPYLFALRKQDRSSVALQQFTIGWAAKLPPGAQPHSLMRAYPRIANTVALLWTEPTRTSFDNYMESLLVDRRGNRKGFPPEVASDLLALREEFDDRRRRRLAGSAS